MIAILLPKTSSYCVAYMDGKDCSKQSYCISTIHGGHSKGREQGCGSLEDLGNCSMRCSTSCIHAVVTNSWLLAAIFALYLKLLKSKLINQTYSEVP